MDKFKLKSDVCKALVDGTLNGYITSLKECKDKKQSMNVSGAYAWTRGNHIDDQVSKIGEEEDITFT